MTVLKLALACAIAASALLPAPALAAEAAAPPPVVLCAADLPTTLADAAAGADDDEPDIDLSALAWRHHHLELHQAFGLATLGSMAATAGLGYWLVRQNGSSGVFDGHLMLAGLTTGLYLTGATLALTAPPAPLVREEGPWDTTRWHRNLGWLHAAGMASVLTLGFLTTFSNLAYSPYHGVAAYSTVGIMALSAGVIVFGE